MTPVYIIRTEKYGELRKLDDNIASARKWAKQALGVGPNCVSRELTYRRCEWCGSSRSLCDCHPPRWKAKP